MPNKPGKVSKAQMKKNCLALIQTAKVMSLGTCDETGPSSTKECCSKENHGFDRALPWIAPVYYWYHAPGFYFFSSPGACHIRQGVNRVCAASIFEDASQFSKIKGVQMSGRIQPCDAKAKTIAIAFSYCRRFGITAGTKEIFDFFWTRFNAKMYLFAPDLIYYMDNEQGIGNRLELSL
ncbi:MAG: hypothetical protein HUK40_23325 [Desulfobacter sp.]|nr:hypothetical protein [Desulfobacter sp.]WDP86658.1 MAG: hypothetical protein HUN05_17275 [Desulfobacter sp.]